MTLAPSDVSTTEVHGPGRLDRDAPLSEPVVERGAVRPEIQALRAIAVLLVVLYHFWPARFPGGYVGVDIFFVISGFLITGQLMREVERPAPSRSGSSGPGGPAGCCRRPCWCCSPRRSSPACGCRPRTGRRLQARSCVGLLRRELARSRATPPTTSRPSDAPARSQHYWSLSLEEQFYVMWPLLLLAALRSCEWFRGRGGRRAVIAALGVVTLGILVFCVDLHDRGEPAAGVLRHRSGAVAVRRSARSGGRRRQPAARRRTLRSTLRPGLGWP